MESGWRLSFFLVFLEYFLEVFFYFREFVRGGDFVEFYLFYWGERFMFVGEVGGWFFWCGV